MRYLFFFIFLRLALPGVAQTSNHPIDQICTENLSECGHSIATESLFSRHPNLQPQADSTAQLLEQFTTQFISLTTNKQVPLFTIPVVVHVVHNNGPENLSDADITDGIALLNEDFSATNEEIPNVIHPNFLPLVADVQVEFKLARLDTNNLPTTGIFRYESNLTYDGNNSLLKQNYNYPREKYLNIWIVNKPFANNNASAFSYYPSSVNSPGSAHNDGVVIAHWAFGRHSGTGLGYEHVLTHEVGHWANLKHTWGDQSNLGSAAACNDDDGVADTPNTKGHAFYGTCTLETFSCGSLDNNNNFMDYTGTCIGMFTQGQTNRIHAALNSSIADRNNLWSPANINATIGDENAPRVVFSNILLQEDLLNDGTINGTFYATLENDQFAISNGVLTQGNDYLLSGFPAGLNFFATITSNTTVEFLITGAAIDHTDNDDINITITLLDNAFDSGNAGPILGATSDHLRLDFLDPYEIVCPQLYTPYVLSGYRLEQDFSLNFGDGDFKLILNSAGQFKLETFGKEVVCFPGTTNILPISAGTIIGPSSNFEAPANDPDFLEINNDQFGNWEGQQAFIGIKITNIGVDYYGWLKGELNSRATSFTIREGAYSLAPNGSIQAGYCSMDDPLVVTIVNQDPSCSNSSDATLYANVFGGQSPYQFTWNNNTVGPSNTNLGSGFYYVQVTDALGKFTGGNVTLWSPSPLSLNMNVTNTTIGSQDGSVSLTVNNGMPPYSYLWSNNATTQHLTNVAPGFYEVSVTDTFGCERAGSNFISEGPLDGYCPAYCEVGNLWIEQVTIAGIDNYSTWTSGYSNYTNQVGEMIIGNSYPVNFKSNNYPQTDKFIAWIDWNQDKIFSSYEEVYSSIYPSDSIVVVPANAVPGITRMRIRLADFGFGVNCGYDYGGEVEDYSISINSEEMALQAKVLLEGPIEPAIGMNSNLNDLGVLPSQEPYSAMGFTLDNAGLSVDPAIFTGTTPEENIVDWVLLQLRNKNDHTQVERTYAMLLQRNGALVQYNATTQTRSTNILLEEDGGEFYVAIIHRNHLPIMTGSSVRITDSSTMFDFTTAAQTVFGTNSRKEMLPGIFALISGDVDEDNRIDSSDRSAAWNNRNQTGYLTIDANLNGTIDAADRSLLWINRNVEGSITN